MAWLGRRLLLCISAVALLALGCLPSRGSALGGLPRPQTNVNFTIAVQGAVWCKNCRYAGYVKSKNVSPLPNAAALLRCRRGKWALSVWGATDAHGYFKIQTAKQSTPFTIGDCKVYVPRSPSRACGVAVRPRRNKGSPIKFLKYVAFTDGLQGLYTAGNFLFGPQHPSKC